MKIIQNLFDEKPKETILEEAINYLRENYSEWVSDPTLSSDENLSSANKWILIKSCNLKNIKFEEQESLGRYNATFTDRKESGTVIFTPSDADSIIAHCKTTKSLLPFETMCFDLMSAINFFIKIKNPTKADSKSTLTESEGLSLSQIRSQIDSEQPISIQKTDSDEVPDLELLSRYIFNSHHCLGRSISVQATNDPKAPSFTLLQEANPYNGHPKNFTVNIDFTTAQMLIKKHQAALREEEVKLSPNILTNTSAPSKNQKVIGPSSLVVNNNNSNTIDKKPLISTEKKQIEIPPQTGTEKKQIETLTQTSNDPLTSFLPENFNENKNPKTNQMPEAVIKKEVEEPAVEEPAKVLQDQTHPGTQDQSDKVVSPTQQKKEEEKNDTDYTEKQKSPNFNAPAPDPKHQVLEPTTPLPLAQITPTLLGQKGDDPQSNQILQSTTPSVGLVSNTTHLTLMDDNKKITTTPPFWQRWWILPFLGMAEGIHTGEKLLVPFLENKDLFEWAAQIIGVTGPALCGFILGCAVYFGAKNNATTLKEKLPAFLTSAPFLVFLLASGFLSLHLAVECTPLLLEQWPALRDHSSETFAAVVLLTGLIAGAFTAVKCTYHYYQCGQFALFPQSNSSFAKENKDKSETQSNLADSQSAIYEK